MDMAVITKGFGVVGLLLITYGIFAKKEVTQDWIFIFGGFGLLIYSWYLRDPIFVPLQMVFILASAYELCKLKKKKA